MRVYRSPSDRPERQISSGDGANGGVPGNTVTRYGFGSDLFRPALRRDRHAYGFHPLFPAWQLQTRSQAARESVRPCWRSRQYLDKRLHDDIRVHAADEERVCFGPFAGNQHRLEFRNDQAARESGGPWIGTVNSRVRASEHQLAGAYQLMKSLEMRRARGYPFRRAVGPVFADDSVKHSASLTWLGFGFEREP